MKLGTAAPRTLLLTGGALAILFAVGVGGYELVGSAPQPQTVRLAATGQAPNVSLALTYNTAVLNWMHSSKRTGGLGYSVPQTQTTNAYKEIIALGGGWPLPPPVTTTTTTPTTASCFESPGSCGYPDPAYGNVGVPMGTILTPSASIRVDAPGATISNLDITGSIYVAANNVTIKDTRVTGSGGNGSLGINVAGGVTGTTIVDSTVRGSGPDGNAALDIAVFGGATIARSYLYNCGECVNGGNNTITDSYVQVTPGDMPGEHYEDVYISDSTVVANHDTLLNPQQQTAVIFGDTRLGGGGAADNHITVTNSLVAGGGYTFYADSASSSVGSATTDISNNRFGRCLTAPVFNPGSGGTDCAGGADSNGYHPYGGYFGLATSTPCPPMPGQQWAGNVWDDNGATVTC